MADPRHPAASALHPGPRHQQCARAHDAPAAPFAVKLLDWLPVLRRIPARLLGLGFRPEHVRTPELPPES